MRKLFFSIAFLSIIAVYGYSATNYLDGYKNIKFFMNPKQVEKLFNKDDISFVLRTNRDSMYELAIKTNSLYIYDFFFFKDNLYTINLVYVNQYVNEKFLDALTNRLLLDYGEPLGSQYSTDSGYYNIRWLSGSSVVSLDFNLKASENENRISLSFIETVYRGMWQKEKQKVIQKAKAKGAEGAY